MSQARVQGPAINPEIRHESHLVQLLALIGKGMSEAISECSAMTGFASDVQKYQFGHYDYLCMRCGAKFDQSACTENSGPTTIIPS